MGKADSPERASMQRSSGKTRRRQLGAGESPRKKQTLSLEDLRKGSRSSGERHSVGMIHKHAHSRGKGGSKGSKGSKGHFNRRLELPGQETQSDGEEEEDEISEEAIEKGSISGVKLRCVVTANRLVRLKSEERGKKSRRFITIADFTGSIDIYVDVKECGLNLIYPMRNALRLQDASSMLQSPETLLGDQAIRTTRLRPSF